jgi:hypothetical protein
VFDRAHQDLCVALPEKGRHSVQASQGVRDFLYGEGGGPLTLELGRCGDHGGGVHACLPGLQVAIESLLGVGERHPGRVRARVLPMPAGVRLGRSSGGLLDALGRERFGSRWAWSVISFRISSCLRADPPDIKMPRQRRSEARSV